MKPADEEELLKAVALRNASSILQARQRAEDALLQARDALQRKSDELAQSLSIMKATLDATTDAILVTDHAGRVTGWNERFTHMWQLPPIAMEGALHSQLLDSMGGWFRDPETFRERVLQIYGDTAPETLDVLDLRDGRVIERHSRQQLIDGRIAGRVWSYRDTTQTRNAEEALRDETRVLELINRTGRNLASQLDLQSIVQSVTDAGTQISGARFGAFFYNVTDAHGDSLVLYTLSGAPREAFAGFGQPRATHVFGPTFRGEEVIRSDDITQDPRYGNFAPHHGMPRGHPPVRSYLAVPVVSRSGQVVGSLFFGHPEPGVFTLRSERIIVGIAAQAAVAIDNARLFDSAQRSAHERQQLLDSERSARQLAERMSALKDDFLATLSHELRTPLSAILGWVHILRRSTRPQDVLTGIDTIERNSRMQVQLIDELLDMNRIASGKVGLDVQAVDPLAFIESALESVKPAAMAKGITIVAALEPGVPPVAGDPSRLQQVMGNLLSNAVKFTPNGGQVDVRLEQEDANVRITVSDTGIGIPSDFIDHVFERFRQADSSTTRRFGGLGLGLSIVKNLVELHGGSISVKSAGENLGAIFAVLLPIALDWRKDGVGQIASGTEGSGALPFTPVDLTNLKVLVVDDDADGRELARRILADCHAIVRTAANAPDALVAVESWRPHVLVSDIGMPDVDGFALLKLVRALGPERGGEVPALALTAFARPEDRDHALDAGFAGHLSKPVDPAALLDRVRALAPKKV